MALMELVNKLIREHGSAPISKEHVELLREEARATEERHAQEIARLKKLHAEQMALRERRTVWLLFCGAMWGLGLALCAVIIEKLYFH
ncbi:MAG: hypothetical protein ABSG14_01555 [Verrucomicrobiia bacterium]|jgi:hypothetical protein